MKKARVGIIVDNLNSSKQIFDFITASQKSNNYEVSHIIIQKISSKKNQNFFEKSSEYIKRRGFKKFVSAAGFKMLTILESMILKRFKVFSDFFDEYSLKEFNIESIEVEPEISENGLFYTYTEIDLQKIRSLNLNLLIRGGSGILKGEILELCKNGIISFHHGDNDFYRGGPPGFWEIINKETRTGFIIQRLGNELDNGEVLFKGYFTTHWIYTINLINLLEKSNIFLHRTVDEITSHNPKERLKFEKKTTGKIYSIPSLYILLSYLFSTLKKILIKILNKNFLHNYKWNIAYKFTNEWQGVNLTQTKIIPNPPSRYLADPFIIKKGDNHYCFVEDYNCKTNKGCISVYEINNDSFKELGVVLEENFHLSYPFLFHHEKELYMCPETHEAKDIRLYKCVDFPLKWKFAKTLIKNVSAVDTNIFYKDKKWWLLTTLSNSSLLDHNSQLHVFSSENILSDDWKPHKKNPVIFDPFFARNAGLIIEDNNFYRVYQKPGFNRYGESLGVAKIEELNEDNYKEQSKFEVSPNFLKDIEGTHTYNFSNGLLVLDFLKTSKK